MSGQGDTIADSNTARRTCARRGCNQPVNKRTAKYCSVRCCTIDPERRERIRVRSRRAHEQPLTMTRQLRLSLSSAAFDPEAQLAQMGRGREDVPAGMSRLVG
jgi:hypothetical protein